MQAAVIFSHQGDADEIDRPTVFLKLGIEPDSHPSATPYVIAQGFATKVRGVCGVLHILNGPCLQRNQGFQ
jgi:hypothetical protein